jgi:GDP-L-fucose synthase
MKTIIFGGHGMLGKALQKNGDFIAPTSDEVNLMDIDQINKFLKSEKPQKVLNLAAKVSGIIGNQKKSFDYFYYNTQICLNVLQSCFNNNVDYLLSCSSTCAYPDQSNVYPLIEEQIFESMPSKYNFGYGLAKRNMIHATSFLNEQHGLNYGIIIPSNLYGPNDSHFGKTSSHFITNLIYKAINCDSKKITIGGSGKPLRQFTHINDVAKAILKMLEATDGDILNFASNEIYSILELAQITLEANSLDYEIEFDLSFPDGQFRKDVSSEKFFKKYDLNLTLFADGIRETFNWYKENY